MAFSKPTFFLATICVLALVLGYGIFLVTNPHCINITNGTGIQLDDFSIVLLKQSGDPASSAKKIKKLMPNRRVSFRSDFDGLQLLLSYKENNDFGDIRIRYLDFWFLEVLNITITPNFTFKSESSFSVF